MASRNRAQMTEYERVCSTYGSIPELLRRTANPRVVVKPNHLLKLL
ncbi:MAG: hypothetical protein QW186_09720 [Candidatus Bathyarchaeia archaeon]